MHPINLPWVIEDVLSHTGPHIIFFYTSMYGKKIFPVTDAFKGESEGETGHDLQLFFVVY